MADQLQLRRGTTSQNLAFTGAQGEVIVDTTLNALVVHNGITAGGFYAATGQQVTQGTFYYNEDVGSAANAYILVPKPNTNTPSSYVDGVQFGFVSIHANTGPSTANFQGLGVKSLKYPGGVDPLAGEIFGRIYLIYDSANGWMEIQRRSTAPPPQIRTIGASVGSNALTATLSPCLVDFRSASLGSGTVSSQSVTSLLSVTAPAGATLGTASTITSRILVLAILTVAGVEIALINLAGGVNLDETNLINTTAITSGSTAANVAYSTTARSGVPYRVMGYIESTQATAGNWSTVPSTVQGIGGQALAALSSIGFGQRWTDQTGSRALTTTYTNTTGSPIMIHVTGSAAGGSSAFSAVVNGVALVSQGQPTAGSTIAITALVPVGATYIVNVAGAAIVITNWRELR